MWPDSSGSRSTSRVLRFHSVSSSRNSTPWCASETSPGRGEQLDATTAHTADLQAALEAETASRASLQSQVDDLQGQVDDQAAAQTAAQDTLDELAPAADANTAAVTGLQQQVTLLRLENALLRAQIQIDAQNLGDARTTLTTTVSAMQTFVETPGVFTADDQASLTVRLRSAASLIEAEPAAALVDLDSIWAEMDRLLSQE